MSGLPPLDPPGVPAAVGPARSPAATILIPDASVAVKWYVPESGAEAASRLLDNRFTLHVPAYLDTEVASVLRRKVAVEGTLSEAEALDVYRRLRSVPMTVHATEGLMEDALRIGIRYRRPFDDSLYLTSAAAVGGRLVTADGRLHRGLQGGPLEHLVLGVTDPL